MRLLRFITLLFCSLWIVKVSAQTNFQKSNFSKPSVVAKAKKLVPFNSTILLGDVDGDGSLTVNDVNDLRNAIIIPDYSLANKNAADLNEDGKISISDITLLIEELCHPAKGQCNGYEYVDLGLSVKWATCNIGAAEPGEYGNYFTWGDTEQNESYLWYYYKHNTIGYYNSDGCKKYQIADGNKNGIWYENGFFVGDGKMTLDADDDAATQLWGEGWRIPTSKEMNELITMCKWTWIDDGYISGYKVERLGRYIFIPAAGCKYSTATYGKGNYGYYWTNTLLDNYTIYARSLYLYAGGHSLGFDERNYGLTVRPVCP